METALEAREISGGADQRQLIDPFGRAISYLRVSVTDRCDFRCVYCMAEDMTFLPKADVLTLEELDRLCSAFIARGVRKLRLTGGEPLVRENIMTLFSSLSRHLRSGALDELTLTTNGSQLAKYARASCRLRRAADQRLARHARSRKVPRDHALGRARQGAAPVSTPRRPPGLQVKINAVALKGVNEDEIRRPDPTGRMARGMDLTLIEVMPMGEIDGDRARPISAAVARAGAACASTSRSTDIDYRTGGPARYVRVAETGGRLGFITPLTHNFCESCNRVRRDLHRHALYVPRPGRRGRPARRRLRASEGDELAHAAIDEAIARKPKGHDFIIDRRHQRPAVARHMSVTGG